MQPLSGGGLAYSDESFNDFLFGPDGQELPAGWLALEERAGLFGDAAQPTADGGVLFATNAAVCRLNPDGSLRWRAPLPGHDREAISGVAEAAEGRSYALSRDGETGSGQQWVFDIGGRKVSEAPIDRSPWGIGPVAVPSGELLVAGFDPPAGGITCYAGDGHKLWQRPLTHRRFTQLALGPAGQLTAASIGWVFHLDQHGQLLWRAAAPDSSLMARRFALGPTGIVTLWQGDALHFLDSGGHQTSPALQARLPQQYRALQSYWVCSPSGVNYVLLLDDPAAEQSPGRVIAISPQVSPLWELPVDAGFVLLAATDDNLIYALISGVTPGSREAEIVCLEVTPPSAPTSPAPIPTPAPGPG